MNNSKTIIKGYSWLLMYRRHVHNEKQYMATTIDQLNLRVELRKQSLAKKIESLSEVDVIFKKKTMNFLLFFFKTGTRTYCSFL